METSNHKYIDLTYLNELSNGSNEFIVQMIEIFIIQTPEALKEIDNYLNKQNWKSLKAIIHKIKPSISFMGIKEIENNIVLVEEYCANETNLEKLPDLISKIKDVCMHALKELELEKKNFI